VTDRSTPTAAPDETESALSAWVSKRGVAVVLAAGVALGGAWLEPALTSASPGHAASGSGGTLALPPPAIPGVARLPGPLAPLARPSTNMGILTVKPQTGLSGTPMKITGSGLAKHAKVMLTWSTANATWDVQTSPGTVNYLGRQAIKFAVVLAKLTTNSKGSFSVRIKAPTDWGGVHDIYAVIKRVQVAHGGFLIGRKFTISPHSGPIGTPITITYTGFAPTLYEGGAALLYDNHDVGELMSDWTRGTGKAMIRASGPVGKHTLEIGDAIDFLYLNLQQSSDSWAVGGTTTFTVTRDNGRPKTAIDWPVKVRPTVSDRTTLEKGQVVAGSRVHLKLAAAAGRVKSRIKLTASGLRPHGAVDLQWGTVVGSRVNCTSICWVLQPISLGRVTPSGKKLNTKITVPDGLGGWHVVQLIQGGKTVAQVPFYVKESLVGKGVSSLVLREGQHFTIHLKGVGWTQLDNTVGVDYDNSYLGYACGFGSNGDVVINLHATGGPGTHLLDLYPMLYTLSPSFANTPYGLLPVLTYANDYPSLALGYRQPAIRLAITVR
jgi:hypothetical protein